MTELVKIAIMLTMMNSTSTSVTVTTLGVVSLLINYCATTAKVKAVMKAATLLSVGPMPLAEQPCVYGCYKIYYHIILIHPANFILEFQPTG